MRFYVPLLLQAFSQSLTYPLVGSITSHGPDGVDALTAFSLGQVIMFMIGALGGGLVMTGMVFAKTREGLASFRRLNMMMMGVPVELMPDIVKGVKELSKRVIPQERDKIYLPPMRG